MGADDTKPSINLAQQADNDLRKKYVAEKADQAEKETDPPPQQEADPALIAPESIQRT